MALAIGGMNIGLVMYTMQTASQSVNTGRPVTGVAYSSCLYAHGVNVECVVGGNPSVVGAAPSVGV